MQVKVKAQIVIVLDESGNLHVEMTSQNKITNLGMLELAKSIVNQKVEPPSPIMVPRV